jgi:hypothetical protein
LGTIIENGPFRDLTYLAHVHADSPESPVERNEPLEATRKIWTDWYEHQCSDRPNTGAKLEAITKALAAFRLALPTSRLDLRATDDHEMKYACRSASAVFDSAVTSLERKLHLPRYGEHTKWINKMNRRVDRAVRQGLYIQSK